MRVALLAALIATPVAVAAADEPSPRIVVNGIGAVMTPPDFVTIDFKIVGEGPTSDVAVAAMVAKRARIVAAVGLSEPRASAVSIAEVRGPDCRRDDDDERAPRLSNGKCAIVGYVAAMETSLRTSSVKDAGTLVGLLGRLEAQNPHFEGFGLSDPAVAQRRAVAAALLDAKQRAEAIAAGTGVKLGRLLVASTDMRDVSAEGDIVVTGTVFRDRKAPIVVDLTPQPIETRAQVTVTYAIAS